MIAGAVGPLPWRRKLTMLTVGLAALSILGCESEPVQAIRARELRLYTGTDSMGVAPSSVHVVPVKARRELLENSGAAMSVEQPGVLFTINDSGNDPILFALDTTGADRGAWRIRNARNVDWEAVTVGPCGVPALTPDTTAPPHRESCVFIGDVGDNLSEYPTRTIYRVREPKAENASFTGELSADALTFSYQEGPRDVEAIYPSPDGVMHLISKRVHRTVIGALRPALVYDLPPSAWTRGTAIARLADSIAIVPGSVPQRWITDASLSRDGRYLAVRTYWQVYVFATDSATGRVIHSISPSTCNIATLGEAQGEGITWYLDTRRLLLTSEGRTEPLRVIDCPLPSSPR